MFLEWRSGFWTISVPLQTKRTSEVTVQAVVVFLTFSTIRTLRDSPSYENAVLKLQCTGGFVALHRDEAVEAVPLVGPD